MDSAQDPLLTTFVPDGIMDSTLAYYPAGRVKVVAINYCLAYLKMEKEKL